MPSLAADEGHKTAPKLPPEGQFSPCFHPQNEFLQVFRPHGGHKPPAFGQLVNQGRGNFGAGRRDQNGIIGGLFRETEGAVAAVQGNILQTQIFQAFEGFLQQRLQTLDTDYPTCEKRQHGRLISGACSNFEHPVARLEGKQFGHAGHHVGLGDGLSLPNGEGLVHIGAVRLVRGQEKMAGYPAHRFEHAGVQNAPRGELRFDHVIPEVPERVVRAAAFRWKCLIRQRLNHPAVA